MADAILEKASSPSGSPKDKLYDMMSQMPLGHVFFQHELTEMGVASDVQSLVSIIQDLASAQLVQVFTHEKETCYKVRTREEAARLIALTRDELLIYEHIADSKTNGSWVKSLKAKTNMHNTNLSKVIKSLENKRLIKTIKNVKFPTRRIYMLSDLNPSEEITGGPWFTDGELDVDLVEALADLTIKFVRERSWSAAARTKSRREERGQTATPKPANNEKTNTGHDQKAKGSVKKQKKAKQAPTESTETAQQLDGSDGNSKNPQSDTVPATPTLPNPTNAADSIPEESQNPLFPPQPHLHPIPPSTSNSISSPALPAQPTHTYPTTAEICAHIRDSGVTSLSFGESEFQDLLDMLVWDGRLETIGPNRYRSVRGTLALAERERNKDNRRKQRNDTKKREEPDDIEDLGPNHKKRKRTKDDVDGEDEDEDVVLNGRDWKKYNRLQAKQPSSDSKNKVSKNGTESSSTADVKLEHEETSGIEDPPEPEFGGLTNGFAEAPCSRCPVFSICGEGGPVSAANCVYFEDWLAGGMKDYEGLERKFQNIDQLRGWQ